MSWFQRLKAGLKKTSQKISESVSSLLVRKKIDEETLENLEDLLILTDMGIHVAQNLTQKLRVSRLGDEITETELKTFLAQEIAGILGPRAQAFTVNETLKPFVVLVVGVNGSGKTTSIAKLGHLMQQQGRSVMFVAADTFRAAAVDQLKVWGERLNIPVMAKEQGADAAGLAYDAFQKARKDGVDVVFIDTAGRLHNNQDLMRELEKIVRVLKKIDPALPHATLLTLDGTSGQNALVQIQEFGKITPLTGVIMTKLDGTAKGGILVQIAALHDIPLVAIGVGEQPEDLNPFEACEFSFHLMGLDPPTPPDNEELS